MRSFRVVSVAGLLACLFGAVGCAGQKEIVTAQYALTVPGFWEVNKVSKAAGEPTHVIIGQYGDAVIDTGAGSGGGGYDARTADVHVWIYAWPASSNPASPMDQGFSRLVREPTFELASLAKVPEQPLECGQFPRAFRWEGQTISALELVRRPGWRTMLVSGVFHEWLVAVVARVEFEQDIARYCHNLRNLRTQLQNLLDGYRSLTPSRVTPGVNASPP